MNQHGLVIVNEKLIETQVLLWKIGTDAIDSLGHLVDLRGDATSLPN